MGVRVPMYVSLHTQHACKQKKEKKNTFINPAESTLCQEKNLEKDTDNPT